MWRRILWQPFLLTSEKKRGLESEVATFSPFWSCSTHVAWLKPTECIQETTLAPFFKRFLVLSHPFDVDPIPKILVNCGYILDSQSDVQIGLTELYATTAKFSAMVRQCQDLSDCR